MQAQWPGGALPRTKDADVFEVVILDVLDYDVLLRLQLQQLECEAHELARLAGAAEGAAAGPQVHCLIDERLRCQPKAVLLPVLAVVDLATYDVLHQVLRGRAQHEARGRSAALRKPLQLGLGCQKALL